MSLVENNHVVEINYTLKNSNGDVVDSSKEEGPLAFIMGKKNIIPGLEAEILGKNVGDSFNATILPEDAYGAINESMIQSVPKSEFGENADQVQVGSQFQVQNENGEAMIVRAIEIKESEIVLDANHPMAGETLHFEVQIMSARSATEEELSLGYLSEKKSDCDVNDDCC